MKKWFMTFCALGLISTQVPTADAASIQEEGQNSYVKQEVKVYQLNQYEDLLADFKNNVTITNIHSFKELSDKLVVSKAELEKLITAQLKEYNGTISEGNTTTKTPSKAENVSQENKKVETPVTTAPSAPKNENTEQKTVVEKETPKAEQTTSAPSTTPASTEQAAKETTQTTTTPVAKADSASAFETQVVELTNAERAKYGLAPLKIYDPLMKVAHAKSQDMATNNYFSHTSPTYGSPFDQIKAAGITYRAAGENIAQGQRTPEEVVQAWMNSEGHRANILNANFTHIGVGYVANGNYWTQQFIQQ